jgi:hypothetical protein
MRADFIGDTPEEPMEPSFIETFATGKFCMEIANPVEERTDELGMRTTERVADDLQC